MTVWLPTKLVLSVTAPLVVFLHCNSIESKKPCDTVFLDFKKAFDIIPHPELLFKLWSHGITGPLWHWFKAYLSNRLHYVSVEGCSSSVLPVRSGVPKGSVLGPLLFLIFVNDIPNATTFCQPYLFADDIKLLESICHPSSSTHLQQDLDSLAQWYTNWKLSTNGSKCAALRFSSPPQLHLCTLLKASPLSKLINTKTLAF